MQAFLFAGADADITIFNAEKIMDRATFGPAFLEPPEGVEHVLMNGIPVVQKGEFVPAVKPGKVIRKTWKIEH